ncbi:MAG: thioredoxin [Bacteroidetes bacterium]|nr:MAG: thioredoxin [Bacteroidota bacterium]
MKINGIFPIIITISGIIFLVVLLLGRNSLNDFISEKMKVQVDAETSLSVEKEINTLYNYTHNSKDYEFTLLEFGSTGCTVCKQMEPVLEEIRNSEKPKVNVVFFNIMHPENLAMMKYFGISAVPMQILLDKTGKEFFRHYGFIGSDDLIALMTVNSVQH